MYYKFYSLLVFLLGNMFSAAILAETTTPHPDTSSLVNLLRQGGYVVYFRHGLTEKTGEKFVPSELIHKCELQRNLSKEGVEQVKRIGQVISKLQIPVGDILSSPYCRCMDTAKHMFGRATRSDSLFFAIHMKSDERAAVAEELKKMLSTIPAQGTNTILISHTANLKEAAGIWPKPEGVAHIFRPAGEGRFMHVGKITPDAWFSMVKSF